MTKSPVLSAGKLLKLLTIAYLLVSFAVFFPPWWFGKAKFGL
jgi:hypothetical protein